MAEAKWKKNEGSEYKLIRWIGERLMYNSDKMEVVSAVTSMYLLNVSGYRPTTDVYFLSVQIYEKFRFAKVGKIGTYNWY